MRGGGPAPPGPPPIPTPRPPSSPTQGPPTPLDPLEVVPEKVQFFQGKLNPSNHSQLQLFMNDFGTLFSFF